MPQAPHNAPASTARDQRLSQLLQLKRCEQPSAAFWEGFEKELRAKQLSSLVRIQPWHERLARACLLAARKTGAPTLATSAVAITLYVVSDSPWDKPNDESGPLNDAGLAERTGTTATKPVFVVEADASEALEAFAADAQTDYTVRALERSMLAPSYQLEATPVTFTTKSPHGSTEAELGAKVLTSKSQF